MSVAGSLALVVLAGIGTYALRASLIVLLSGRTLPGLVVRALRHVGPAVLAALVVSFAAGGSGVTSGLTAAEAAALAVAGGVAWWRRNLIVTLVAGMATLWVATLLT